MPMPRYSFVHIDQCSDLGSFFPNGELVQDESGRCIAAFDNLEAGLAFAAVHNLKRQFGECGQHPLFDRCGYFQAVAQSHGFMNSGYWEWVAERVENSEEAG